MANSIITPSFRQKYRRYLLAQYRQWRKLEPERARQRLRAEQEMRKKYKPVAELGPKGARCWFG